MIWTILAKLDEAELKIEELRKNGQKYTVNYYRYLATNFRLIAYYSK